LTAWIPPFAAARTCCLSSTHRRPGKDRAALGRSRGLEHGRLVFLRVELPKRIPCRRRSFITVFRSARNSVPNVSDPPLKRTRYLMRARFLSLALAVAVKRRMTASASEVGICRPGAKLFKEPAPGKGVEPRPRRRTRPEAPLPVLALGDTNRGREGPPSRNRAFRGSNAILNLRGRAGQCGWLRK